ncbi:MAG: permease prefix domain 1-containing protein [Bryobacteraceae bacterium]
MTSTAEYLNRIERGLRGRRIAAPERREILTELEGHLTERIAEFEQQGSPEPVQRAMAAMGDPEAIARQFHDVRRMREASRSASPMKLLAAVGRLALTGVRGLFLFVIGITGYSLTLGFALVGALKVIVPSRVGLWVGESGFVWGLPRPGFDGQELAGDSFASISFFLACVFAAGTTFLLQSRLRSRARRAEELAQ